MAALHILRKELRRQSEYIFSRVSFSALYLHCCTHSMASVRYGVLEIIVSVSEDVCNRAKKIFPWKHHQIHQQSNNNEVLIGE